MSPAHTSSGHVAGLVFDGSRLIGPARVTWQGGVITGVQALPPGQACRRTILPGLVDGHIHLTAYAQSLLDLDLTDLDARAILSTLAAKDRQTTPHEWIRGRQVRPESWPAVADRQVLDRVSSHPVVLWSADLHLLALNTTALDWLGVAECQSVTGGEIVRDSRGNPTGVLKEKAAEMFARLIPEPSRAAIGEAIHLAIRNCHAAGLVAAVSYETPAGLEQLATTGADPSFDLRLFQYAQDIGPTDQPGAVARDLPVVGAKIFLDGTLGSRTAWMKEPFCDRGARGICRLTPDAPQIVATLRERGYIISLHAIGDAAFSAAITLLDGKAGRIEHIQVVDPADLELVTPQLVASVQPAHLIGDRRHAVSAWGTRARYAYPYRSLWERGATLLFGSDAPVVPPDPLVALKMAVDRRLGDEPAFGPEQAVPIEAALAAVTTGPARTLDLGPGGISVGGPATLTLVEGDLRSEQGRRSATIGATVVAGKMVYGDLP